MRDRSRAREILTRSVDDTRPRAASRWAALHEAAVAAAALTGLALLLLCALEPAAEPTTTAPPAPPAPPAIVPIVIPSPQLVRAVVEPPPPPPAGDDLGCPVPPVPDEPIGRPLDDDAVAWDDGAGPATVVASARAPAIAVLRQGRVQLSVDDGRRFAPVLGGDAADAIDAIALDDAGRLYAVAGARLAVRTPDGRARWSSPAIGPCPTDDCASALVAAGHRVLWLRGARGAITADGGRTWRALDDDDAAAFHDVGAPDGRLVGWGAAAYATEHVVDMCGVDDQDVATIDLATGAFRHDVFHGGDDGGPTLVARADGPTWRYEVACNRFGDGTGPGADRPCPRAQRTARVRRALEVAVLRPVVGGRTLFVDHDLAELCGDRARVVDHAFPFDRVDAVDAGGRPLVVVGGRLLRRSPRHGWRLLLETPPRGGG